MKYFKNLYYKIYGKITGKKYVLKKEGNLYRIIYVKNLFNNTIKIGDLGGKVDSYSCLSHKGNCYIDFYSTVTNRAKILDNTEIRQTIINGYIKIEGNSNIFQGDLIEVKGEINNSKIINSKFNKYINIKNSNIENSTIENSTINYSTIKGSTFNFVNIKDSTSYYSIINRTFAESVLLDNNNIKCSTISISTIKDSTIESVDIDNAYIQEASIKSIKDFIIFKNWWSSGRIFTWTKSNNMWNVGCFHGSGEELIERAYKDSLEKGKEYEKIVNYVNSIK